MTDGYFSPIEVDRLGRAMPHGIVRFTESGKLADWREDILGWMVTGSDRVWGDPLELVRTFGPYEAIAVVSPTPPTDEELRQIVSDANTATYHAVPTAELEAWQVTDLMKAAAARALWRAGFVAGNQEQEK